MAVKTPLVSVCDGRTPESPTIGLALGGGGARGLAHVLMLEACDELGLRPSVIAGTSIGSLIGAAYASGMRGADVREYCLSLFANRTALLRRLFGNGNGRVWDLWSLRKPAFLNAQALMQTYLPEQVCTSFEELEIPLIVVATDFLSQSQYVIEKGPLVPAVAASSALPGLLTPVELDGRILIDGGFVNPLPFDLLKDRATFTIAVDVSAGPPEMHNRIPNMIETVLGSTQITLRSIIREKLRAGAPDVLIKPNVGHYRVLDFFKIAALFEEAAPAKDQLKRAVEKRLNAASR